MKKYMAIIGLPIITNIPEKAHNSSNTFHHSDKSNNLTPYYPFLVAYESCYHPDFGWALDRQIKLAATGVHSRGKKGEDSGNEFEYQGGLMKG